VKARLRYAMLLILAEALPRGRVKYRKTPLAYDEFVL
jgi:hypothetical protein